MNIFKSVVILTCGIIILAIVIGLYPFKEYVLNEQPYRVNNKQVKTGGTLSYEVDYCKLSDASGEITLIWEGASRAVVNLGTFQAGKGCVKTTTVVPVPVDLLPGQYRLHGHGEYPKFLVGKAKVDTFTDYFEVIK